MRTSASRLKDGSGQICEPRAVSRLASRQLTAREPLTDNADPPATMGDSGLYTVPCDAKPPKLGFTFGKVTFSINPVDMIVTDAQLPKGTCFSAVQSENSVGRPILGDTFFRNVVVIHDWTKMQMQ
jgi:hypothetical protein